MQQNKEEINAGKLYELLESISKYVDRKVKFYALGGTALTILRIKNSTRDVDINIESSKEHAYIISLFEQIGFDGPRGIRWFTQEGLAFDLFYGSHIFGTELLDDCLSKSMFIKSFGNIELYTLSLHDIIISKLARGDLRDFEDIKAIFENETINLQELVSRYKKTMETCAHYQQKLLDLIEIKFKQWKLSIDSSILDEVKQWQ